MKKLLLLIILLNSCSYFENAINGMFPKTRRVSAEDWANADHGKKISKTKAIKEAKKYMSSRLKDPYSTKYDFQDLKKDYLYNNQSDTIVWGWALYGNVNTKNSFGAYIGNSRCRFFFLGDYLDDVTCENNI